MFHIEQAMQLLIKAKLLHLKGYFERTHSPGEIEGDIMERQKCFLNFLRYAKEIKRILSEHLSDFDVYAFGSVLRDDFSPGLSDIDIAIVSDEFRVRERKLEIYDLLFEKFFETPFEFHLLTKEMWKFYLRFIDEYRKI